MLLALAVTPMRKLAALCEFFGVRTALHGPGDCSSVGMMANLAIDLSVSPVALPPSPPLGVRPRTKFPLTDNGPQPPPSFGLVERGYTLAGDVWGYLLVCVL